MQEQSSMRKYISSFLTLLLGSGLAFSQNAPFTVEIEPISISGVPGIQSYAFGVHDGKWLIVGGRLDGLHRRQPFAAFDVPGLNTNIIVVDPVENKSWTKPLSTLPQRMQEQLSSTNMSFEQEGDFLYVVGGYGYSLTDDDHITYPYLTALNVPDLMDAVINDNSITAHCRQMYDTLFAVAGGHLGKIYNTFYLTGGNKFMGRYNPQGPDFGPGFVQQYTNAIRKFSINDDGTTIQITHFAPIVDEDNLHRRDYNVVSQILPSVQEGLIAFSGVFQKNVDLPFLNAVVIDSGGYSVNDSFSQYFNHYHCAHIPLYSATNNEMHNLFFGGIAQYFMDSTGVLVQDNNVPFVRTIARVSIDASGKMTEYKLPVEMPAYLGAGSEFIPIHTVPSYDNEVFKLDDFTNDTTLVGYVFGGISSSAPNIFFTNTGTQSSATNQIFKVYIIKNKNAHVDVLNLESIGSLKLQVYPNPNKGDFYIKFDLRESCNATVTIRDINGKIIKTIKLDNLSAGNHTHSQHVKDMVRGGVYLITLETPYEKTTQRVIIRR